MRLAQQHLEQLAARYKVFAEAHGLEAVPGDILMYRSWAIWSAKAASLHDG